MVLPAAQGWSFAVGLSFIDGNNPNISTLLNFSKGDVDLFLVTGGSYQPKLPNHGELHPPVEPGEFEAAGVEDGPELPLAFGVSE
jgi:hypothetical protein